MRTVRLLQLKQIMGFLATVFMLAGTTHAQTFPDRPITIVVPRASWRIGRRIGSFTNGAS